MKLKVKIWLLLSVLLGVVLTLDLSISHENLKAEIRAEIDHEAKAIFGFMMATRRIYQEQFIASGLEVNENTIGFLPAHSFSRISRDFADRNRSGIIFNNVSDVPRNPANKADRFEMEAIAWFKANPQATERLSDITTDRGVGYLLFTAPIRIEPFCLKCHGEREAAPPSIRERYATAYGYKVGEMRGVVSIRIPTARFEERVWRSWSGRLIKSLAGYAAIFLALGLILDRLVLRRLGRLREGAERIAEGEYGTRIGPNLGPETHSGRRDEIDSLASTFNHMADEIQSRDRTLVKLSRPWNRAPPTSSSPISRPASSTSTTPSRVIRATPGKNWWAPTPAY